MDKQGLIEVERLDVDKMTKRESIGEMMIGLGLAWMVFFGGVYFYNLSLPRELSWIPLVSLLIMIVLHEGAHGIAFKIFTGKVKFGVAWKNKLGGLVAYATSPNSILTKRQMVITTLAPQVMTVIFLALSPILLHTEPWVFYSMLSMAAFNLGGGCADMYSVYLVAKQKGRVFVEDTATGMIIYRKVGA